MADLQPIYIAENCRYAYQLNWSLSLFANAPLPSKAQWLPVLAEAAEADHVRLLECRQTSDRVAQFFVSTAPEISPSEAIRSIKGRLQYLLRETIPRAFRRNYRLESVGEANSPVLEKYVANQMKRHPMADVRVQQRMEELQFQDEAIDLSALRYSAHGQFVYNLHVVLENADYLHDVRPDSLTASREMLIRACVKKGWLLSRIGLVSNHVHLLLGCDVADVPRDVALSLLNNLAYAHGMKAVYEFSFYVGTFGNYDRNAIREKL